MFTPTIDGPEVTAIILCGGQGTRLRDVIPNTPKALAILNGMPFIHILLQKIEEISPKNVILCTGHLGSQIREVLGDSYRSLRLIYSHEESPLGTAGALRNAAKHLDTQLIFVTNGDSFLEIQLMDYVRWHRKVCSKVSLVVKEVSDVERYGKVEMNKSGEITEFTEKSTKTSSSKGFINTGNYLMDRETINNIPEVGSVSLEREVLPSLIADGVSGYVATGRFIDIGTPESLKKASQFFSKQRMSRDLS
jgi:NDP-sugar pyrophosphorylase family protein